MAAHELAHQEAQQVNYLPGEVEQRPRFSSLARWGMFEGKTQETDDEAMEANPMETPQKETSTTLITTGGYMPRPPIYKSASQSHKRAVMDAYLAYERTVQVMIQSTGIQIFRMTVGACIEHKTMVRICKHELMRSESKLTEADWMRYFVEAKASDNSRSLSLKKAMKNLQMRQEHDGKNPEWIALSETS
uniref:Uncharacterized protein AlNc14C210G8912 n=1 Tax=Albugo laibachii Nc14 TaxID=890382 RepID=F0WRA5_9STRA|nr:conserved hypothetical protein [Albugo laibachii Nc14]CCA24052.1 conserved hypothetical protein [Albugo laibachii Nc14]|eukprot:CCA24052.1 conserved hypothetical protein [Albugo laibachii Nc14]